MTQIPESEKQRAMLRYNELNELAGTITNLHIAVRLMMMALGGALAAVIIITIFAAMFGEFTPFVILCGVLFGGLGGYFYYEANKRANQLRFKRIELINTFFMMYEILHPNSNISISLISLLNENRPRSKINPSNATAKTVQAIILSTVNEDHLLLRYDADVIANFAEMDKTADDIIKFFSDLHRVGKPSA